MNRIGQWNRALPLVLAIGMASMASAQGQAVGGKPDVQIDTSVLDRLGPPPDLPGMLLQHEPAEAQKIILTPPGANKSAYKRHAATVRSPAAEAGEGVVHLHPIKPRCHHATRHHAVKRARCSHPAVPATTRETGPTSLTPTLSQGAAPPPVAIEPVKPAATSGAAAPPAASAPTAPPAPASTSTALTAQPATPETAIAAPTQESLSTISFDKESGRLPEGARDSLAHLASRMTEDATLEVQLLAYAAGDEENASKARRLSLSRALAVRSFLIDQGVRSTRIEVRALGNKVPEGVPDRVDIVVQKRG